MNETVKIIFALLGGLAVFIFGMNMMSECLQKAAGEKMRTILSMLTKNPVLGVIAGALTTAVLQSSSATTVMAIGFVSAGLMSLPQAISIILGANIGTTITAQIIAFKVTDYIYLLIFAGFLIAFIGKSEKVKNIGQTIFAFGLLFLGIETMGDVMKPLASSPIFINMIGEVANVPVLGVVLGTVMTFAVQSSSATIAVLQNFASQAGPDGVSSIIGLAGAIPILLGDNVGTTITAILASVGQSRDAKRTAVAHCVFNISGCLLFIWFTNPYAAFIQWISPKGPEVEVISRQIANAHTGFNLVMTLIWIPLIMLMVKIVTKIIPDRTMAEQKLPSEPQYLDNRLVGQPVAAFQLVAKEAARCSGLVEEILAGAKELSGKAEQGLLQKIVDDAKVEHELNDHINEYLTLMFSEGAMTEEQTAQGAGILYLLNDIDRMGILCGEIAQIILRQNERKRKFSKEAIKDLRKSLGLILQMYTEAMQAILGGSEADIENIRKRKGEIMLLDEKMRRAHMERVGKKKCDAKLLISFNEILHNIDRMGNCCVNLADTAVEQTEFGMNRIVSLMIE